MSWRWLCWVRGANRWRKPLRPSRLLARVLALGPELQVAGRVLPVTLPYAWIEWLLPILKFSSAPARFSWLTTFGCAVAGGAGLTALCERGRRGCLAAVVITSMALVECWPCDLPTTNYPTIPIMQGWSRGSGAWAVLDATGWSRCLWHQMQHHRPIVGGYVTREATTARNHVVDDPVLMVFLGHLFRTAEPSRPPDATAICRRLAQLHIRFVVVTTDREQFLTNATASLRVVERSGDIVIFQVPDV